jgi:hypothetical protein
MMAENPANGKEKRTAARIPMSTPTRALEVPELPGFHMHWFLERNVGRALKGGYEYVDAGEVDVNNRSVADDLSLSGSTDMGSRISIIGSVDEMGKAENLYLMKIRQEWYEADQQVLAKRNDGVAQALRTGLIGAEGDPERHTRYVKQGAGLFFPKQPRKA